MIIFKYKKVEVVVLVDEDSGEEDEEVKLNKIVFRLKTYGVIEGELLFCIKLDLLRLW